LRSRRSSASPEQRRAILAATTALPDQAIFGVNLASTRTAAYLLPGAGERSLATVVVPSNRLRFDATWREGSFEPDVRVELPVPILGNRWLPVKDHHLLLMAERATSNVEQQIKILEAAVQRMGKEVAVRLGLSRSFQGRADRTGVCWLMA